MSRYFDDYLFHSDDPYLMTEQNQYYGTLTDEFIAHHGIKGQKWGVRRFQNYDGTLIKRGNSVHAKAKKLYMNAKKRVNKIMSDVSSCAELSGMQMYGLDHKLKQIPSIERKIDKRMVEDEMTEDEAANSLKDIVRFTTISDTQRLVNNYQTFKELMKVNGYTESRCKNYFEAYKRGEVKHKSIQCNYRTPDGYEFEIQFHTPESQDVKNRKIPLYEEVRKKNVSPERAKEIEIQMAKMADEIPDPPYIEKIKSHS